jgi:hypothetical protein
VFLRCLASIKTAILEVRSGLSECYRVAEGGELLSFAYTKSPPIRHEILVFLVKQYPLSFKDTSSRAFLTARFDQPCCVMGRTQTYPKLATNGKPRSGSRLLYPRGVILPHRLQFGPRVSRLTKAGLQFVTVLGSIRETSDERDTDDRGDHVWAWFRVWLRSARVDFG